MVPLPIVIASNDTIPESLAPGLVAVFAGGTSGIGEITFKTLAKRTIKPKFYLVGRSSASAERIIAECRILNPEGQYVFLQKDLDLMKNVEEVCDEIKKREKFINLLVLSAGDPDLTRTITSESLHRFYALMFYGRNLFIQTLLPLLHAAPPHTLKRVLNIAAGCFEGPIQADDLPALTLSVFKLRGHAASMITLVLQHFAAENPDVTFVTDHPGTVITPAMPKYKGYLGTVLRTVLFLFGRWMAVPLEESGERHAFLATSATFAPKSGEASGIQLVEGLEVHVGADGETASGMYSVAWDCEGPGDKSIQLLKGYHADGMADKVWEHYRSEMERIKSR